MLNSIGSGQNKGGIERKEEMELRKDEPLQKKVAEEERFELSEGFHLRWFSRPVHSTTLPPLRSTAQILLQNGQQSNSEFPVCPLLYKPALTLRPISFLYRCIAGDNFMSLGQTYLLGELEILLN
jgi:hypothetical protein